MYEVASLRWNSGTAGARRVAFGRASRRRVVLGVLLGAALTGCAVLRDEGGNEPVPRAETIVQVSNHSWSDLRIYAVVGGTRFRLGTVSPNRREILTVPPSIVAQGGRFQLLALPIGANWRHVSEPILLMPGQTLVWRVENNRSLSSLQVM